MIEYVQLEFVPSGSTKKRTVWAKRLSDTRFLVVDKEGDEWFRPGGATKEIVIVTKKEIEDGRAVVRPARMNTHYAELELKENRMRSAITELKEDMKQIGLLSEDKVWMLGDKKLTISDLKDRAFNGWVGNVYLIVQVFGGDDREYTVSGNIGRMVDYLNQMKKVHKGDVPLQFMIVGFTTDRNEARNKAQSEV